jgi:photosystem II stability/assembly factor-like uncharacterized protein
LAHLGSNDDYVLDHIVIDPQAPDTIFVSAWSVTDQKTGELFRSRNGGKTWETIPAMQGKSIRGFAVAPSDSRILVAGTRDGIYRTRDGGDSWERMSPADDAEIKNVESIAIDPIDPKVVYAGTWHLAWKTDDDGLTWSHITKGMIDDSDVFSIIINSSDPAVVFASACSGIYKSDNAGLLFHKVQGIPFSARRTRVLKQDPTNPNVVYAGTTEGLWRSGDSGKDWRRMTGSEIVVNDVLVDPRNANRVLLATDRGGVIASDNAAQTFAPSNHGYTHRYVTAILIDKNDPDALYVGVSNDREWGGVFSLRLSGQRWRQESVGLGGRDVLTLTQTDKGALVAGTNRGVFIMDRDKIWRSINTIVSSGPPAARRRSAANRHSVRANAGPPSLAEAQINQIEVAPRRWLAATSIGLFASTNEGKSWTGGPVVGKTDLIAICSQSDLQILATRSDLLVSENGGSSWQQLALPARVTTIRGLTLTPDAQIFVASRGGAFRSVDGGQSWQQVLNGLPDREISSLSYAGDGQELLATSMATGVVFESADGGKSWHNGPDSGYPLRRVSVIHGHIVGVTPFDGLIAQP